MEFFLTLRVSGQTLKRLDSTHIMSGSKNLYYARISFDSGWDSVTAYAQFRRGETVIANTPVTDGVCTVPNAVYAEKGSFSIGVFGGDLVTVNSVEIAVEDSGYSSQAPEDISQEDGFSYVQTPSDETGLEVIRFFDGLEKYDGSAWQKLDLDDNVDHYSKSEADSLLDAKSDTTHEHNNLYYSKVQTNMLLASKASAYHNHDTSYYSKVQTDILLSARAAANHDHDGRYYTESETDALISENQPKIFDADNNNYYTFQLKLVNGKPCIEYGLAQ